MKKATALQIGLIVACMACVMFAPKALGAVGIYRPINYQGKLSGTGGLTIPNGTYNMRFKIYNQATGGSPVWVETWDSTSQRVTATGGLFSIALGTHTTMTGSVDFNSDSLYLEVSFDPGNDNVYEEIFAPRRRFASVPYAHNANALDGLDASQFIRSDTAATASGTLTINPKNARKLGLDILSQGGSSATGALRLSTQGGAHILFGSGGLNYDTNLYRVSANTLKTDDALQVVGTLSGSRLVISNNANISGSLLVLNNITTRGTLSGSNLTVSRSASISGTLIVKTGITSKGSISGSTISGFNLGSCNAGTSKLLYNNSTNKFECGTISSSSSFGTGNVLTIGDARYVKKSGDTMTGTLILNPQSGLALNARGTVSGRVLQANIILTSSGILSVTQKQQRGSGALVTDQQTNSTGAYFNSRATSAPLLVLNARSADSAAAPHILFGYNGTFDVSLWRSGTSTLKTNGSFHAVGVLSGSNLTVSRSASISGTLIVKTGITSKGSLSGSTFYGAGLGTCTGTYQKLLYNPSTGKFTCGAISTASTFGTGNVLTIGDARYVKKSGDTMTGILIVKQTISGSRLTISENANISGALLVKGNVGIGTTSPGYKLHIGNGAGVASAVMQGTHAYENLDRASSSYSAYLGFSTNNLTSPDFQLGLPGSATYFSIGNNNFATKFLNITSTGNVGIGTTAPKAKLDVVGTISGSSLSVTQNANISGALLVKGNVGIGTTSPSSKLEVNGGAIVLSGTFGGPSGGSEKRYIGAGGTSDHFFFNVPATGGGYYFAIGESSKMRITNSGDIGIGKSSPATKLDVAGTISGALITQNGAGNNYFMGNVGIGATSPAVKLVVKETSVGVAPMYLDAQHTGTAITNVIGPVISNSNATTNNWAGILFSDAIGGAASGLMGVQFTDRASHYGDFAFLTRSAAGATEKMRILSTGEIGIGTTAPKAKLDVVGTISGSSLSVTQNANISGALLVKGNVGIGTTSPSAKLTTQENGATAIPLKIWNDTTTAGRYSDIRFSHSNGAGTAGIRGYGVNLGANNESQLRFYTSPSSNSPTERMTIDQAGNVGIGTTAPKAKLDVVGTISGSSLSVTQNANISGALLVKGNVGIGTTSPSAKVTVSASGNGNGLLTLTETASSPAGFVQKIIRGNNDASPTAAEAALVISDHSSNVVLHIQDHSSNPLFTVLGAGNVGIGSTSPKARLDVQGTMSGINLTVSRSASISGTLIVKTGITSKGSLSGSTFYGAGLGTCTGTYQKLLYNPSTGKFTCGAISTASTFGTGNVLTIGDARYVRKSGDTMTGALVIAVTNGNINTLGLRVINTISGAILHAERGLTSSGYIFVTQSTVRGSGALVVRQNTNSTGAYIMSLARGAPVLALDNNSGSLTGAGRAPHILFGYRGTFDVALFRSSGAILNLSGSLLPSITNKFDLGSSARRFRSLYLSGGTIFLGNSSNDSAIHYNTSASRFGIDIANNGSDEFTIMSNGNVGIGTTSPQASTPTRKVLELEGVGATDDPTFRAEGPNNVTLEMIAYGSAVADANRAAYIGTISTHNLILMTKGLARLTVSSGGLVGIGTTSPGAKLEISGTSNPSIKFTSTSDANYHSYIKHNYDSNNAFGIYSGTSDTQVFGAANNVGSVFFPNGNVGIGTTAPKAKLDVVGTISGSLITQNGAGSNYFLGNVGFGTKTPTATVDIEKTSAVLRISGTSSANSDSIISLRGGAGGAGNTQLFSIRNNSNSVVHMNTQNSARLALGVSTGTSEGSIEENLTIISSGNVGIGTTSPSNKLEVSGTNNTTGIAIKELATSGSRGTYLDFINANNGGADPAGELRFYGNTSTQVAGIKVVTGVTGATGYLTFSTNGGSLLERMRIDTAGNVGIGTTSPAALLEVKGSKTHSAAVQHMFINNTSTGNPVVLALSAVADNGGTGNMGAVYFDAGADGTAADNQIQFNADHQSDTNPDLVITGAGNVGIGTTSPENILHVYGGSAGSITANGNSNLVIEDSSTSYIQMLTPDANEKGIAFGEPSNGFAGGIYYNNSSTLDGLQFRTNGNSTKMSIDSAGNVGIGTTAPNYKLEVNGSSGIGFTDTAGSGINYDSQIYQSISSPDRKLNIVSKGGAGGWRGAVGVKVNYNNGSLVEGLTVRANTDGTSANVGIGTTSPAAALDVAGVIKGTHISIDTNTIEERYTNADNGSVNINYRGYNGGTTKYRDFAVYDGKNATLMYADGSAGNVGIGTTSPAVKFHVSTGNSTGRGAGDVISETAANGNAGYAFRTNGSDRWSMTILGTDGSNQFRIRDENASAERLRIDNAGNVGIGTTSPGAKLDIRGDALFNEDSGDYDFRIESNDNANIFVIDGGTNKVGIGGAVDARALLAVTPTATSSPNATNWPNVRFNAGGAITINHAMDSFQHVKIEAPTITIGAGSLTNAASLYVESAPSAATNNYSLWIDSGNARFDGNVGIGTTAPKAQLDVIGTISGSRLSISNNANISGALLVKGGIDLAANTWITGTTATNGNIIRNSYLGYNSTYRAIQIGNQLGSETGNNQAIALGIDPTTIAGGSFYGDEIALPNTVEFMQANSGKTDWIQDVLVLNNGSVGIGTSSPGGKLDIVSTTDTWAEIKGGQVSTAQIRLTADAGDDNSDRVRTYVADGGKWYFQDYSAGSWATNFMIDSSTGNHGFGTTSPDAIVQISQGGLCVGSDSNCNTDNDTEGVIYSSSTAMTVYDVAEMYPTKDTTLTGADIVSLDTINGVFVKRAAPGARRLLGIVSAEPAVLLGGFNGAQFKEEHQVAIALSGRVPVHVTLENGPIVIGDDLTVSRTQTGVAMKANGGDQTIGYALEDYDGTGTGDTILVFVRTGDVQPMQIDSSGAALRITSADLQNPALLIQSHETDGSKDAIRITTDVGSENNTVFRVNASGAVFSDSTFNSQGADYAEWFKESGKANTQKLQPGEVVCIDILASNTVTRCERSADPNIMGIVSTNPAFIGNSIRGADGMKDTKGYVLVGLIGQVPAKVTLEGGPIRAGDSLTASATPGFARRALAGESTVGVALEPFDGSTSLTTGGSQNNTINVLISRRNQSLTVETVEQKVLASIASMNISDEVSRLVESASNALDVDARVTDAIQTQMSAMNITQQINTTIDRRLSGAALTVQGTLSTAQIEQVTQLIVGHQTLSGSLRTTLSDLESRMLAIESSLSGSLVRFGSGKTLHAAAATIDRTLNVNGALHLSGSLILSKNSRIGSMSFSGSEVQIGSLVSSGSLRVLGNITIDGLALFLGDVHIRGQLVLSGKQAGFASIPKSGSSVTVLFNEPMIAVPVVTATPDVPTLFAVSKVTATGFTIRISPLAPEKITFSYIALAVQDPKNTNGTGSEIINEPIPFPVNALGQPVSSDTVWNSCIHGRPLILSTGEPVSCARYHDGYIWEQPDLHISFTYKPNSEPPVLIVPEGYVITVIDAPLPAVAPPAPEPEPEPEVAEEETEQEAEESPAEDSSTEESSSDTTEDSTEEAVVEEEETDASDEGTTDPESSNTSPAASTTNPETKPATPVPEKTTPETKPSAAPATESADPAPAPTVTE